MSFRKIEHVKKDRGFKIWDLIVYGVIVAIVVAVFIAVYVTKDGAALSGIRVTLQGNEVFKYNFESKKIELIDRTAVSVLEEDGEVLKIKVECDGGYNVFWVNKGGSVKMKEADCSKFHPDCLYMAEVKDNNGFIYCLPHGLKIEPYKYVPNKDVTM